MQCTPMRFSPRKRVRAKKHAIKRAETLRINSGHIQGEPGDIFGYGRDGERGRSWGLRACNSVNSGPIGQTIIEKCARGLGEHAAKNRVQNGPLFAE